MTRPTFFFNPQPPRRRFWDRSNLILAVVLVAAFIAVSWDVAWILLGRLFS